MLSRLPVLEPISKGIANALVSRVEADNEFEEWLGFVTGAGIVGFLGVVLALLLSAHRAVGHSNFIDKIGLELLPCFADDLDRRATGERLIHFAIRPARGDGRHRN